MGTYCDMRGFLSFIVLRLISKKNLSGEELRVEIKKRKGAKPSAGTIYPVLKGLSECKLIEEVSGSGRTKKYRITKKGLKELDVSTERFIAIFYDMKEEFRRC